MVVLYLTLLLLPFSALAKVVPSKSYIKKVNESLQLQQPMQKRMLPPPQQYGLQPLTDPDGSGDPARDPSCRYINIEQSLYQLQFLAYTCVDQLEFRDCCEPKFLRYQWLSSTIYPILYSQLQFVYCDMETFGGGWMVILRRTRKKVERLSNLTPYRKFERGFGKLQRDFWLGLQHIRYFTLNEDTELLVELELNDTIYYARYDNFSVGDRRTNYTLTIGGYRNDSTLPDSLSHNNGSSFKTSDHNDRYYPEAWDRYTEGRCGSLYAGGWWFGPSGNEVCTKVALLQSSLSSHSKFKGLLWEMDGIKVKFDRAEMKIRPKKWECGINQYSKYVVQQAFLSKRFPHFNPFYG